MLDGIDAAAEAGLAVKLNMVAMRGVNDDEIETMMAFAHARGFGLTLIEGMPLGEVGIDRVESYLPLRELRERLAAKYTLEPTAHRTGGPARYDWVKETKGLLGFITPMSHNFCESCNRVRLTATGQLYLCLGQDDMVDLRAVLRGGSDETLDAATPYDGALEVRRRFAHSSLIAEPGGTTHADSLSGDKCVDNKIAAYLRDGTLPDRKDWDGPDAICSPIPNPRPH